MTLIIAAKAHDGSVLMCADRIATEQDGFATVLAYPKIHRKGALLVGFAGLAGFTNILWDSWPKREEARAIDLDVWMRTTLVPWLRDRCRETGLMHEEKGACTCSSWLVAVEGRIFDIDHRFAVIEGVDYFRALGYGREVATAILRYIYTSPTDRYLFNNKVGLREAMHRAFSYAERIYPVLGPTTDWLKLDPPAAIDAAPQTEQASADADGGTPKDREL